MNKDDVPECENCGIIDQPLKDGFCEGCTCLRCHKHGSMNEAGWCDDCEQAVFYITAGEKVNVVAHYSDPGKGLRYTSFEGIITEDARIGSWDVVDVRNSQDEIVSVYCFSLEKSNAV